MVPAQDFSLINEDLPERLNHQLTSSTTINVAVSSAHHQQNHKKRSPLWAITEGVESAYLRRNGVYLLSKGLTTKKKLQGESWRRGLLKRSLWSRAHAREKALLVFCLQVCAFPSARDQLIMLLVAFLGGMVQIRIKRSWSKLLPNHQLFSTQNSYFINLYNIHVGSHLKLDPTNGDSQIPKKDWSAEGVWILRQHPETSCKKRQGTKECHQAGNSQRKKILEIPKQDH